MKKNSKSISLNKEVDQLIKKYKKLKKSERSNLSHIKKLDKEVSVDSES